MGRFEYQVKERAKEVKSFLKKGVKIVGDLCSSNSLALKDSFTFRRSIVFQTSSKSRDVAWYWFGRSLAVANLVYFSINMFGFLIPRFLSRAFERYFRERDEIHSKMAEDKYLSTARNTQQTYKKMTEEKYSSGDEQTESTSNKKAD